MTDFQTIDSKKLEVVSGGALPIKPIIKGVEKGAHLVKEGYEAAKPYAKKAWDGINFVGTASAVGETVHQGWNYFFGHKQQPQSQPAGGQP